MPNISFTATTTSQVLPIGEKPKAVNITNMGTNPVTIRFCEDGSAVDWAWVVLPFQYATFSFDNREMWNYNQSSWDTSVITTWGSSNLAIFYV